MEALSTSPDIPSHRYHPCAIQTTDSMKMHAFVSNVIGNIRTNQLSKLSKPLGCTTKYD
jgi:hypothetical protein